LQGHTGGDKGVGQGDQKPVIGIVVLIDPGEEILAAVGQPVKNTRAQVEYMDRAIIRDDN